MKLMTLSALLAAGLLLACSNQSTAPTAEPRAEQAGLTRTHAQHRAERVSDVRYQFALNLPAENQPFTGRASIHFKLADAREPLTLDFEQGTVQSVSINGKPVAVDHNGYFITLPAEALRKGPQTVEVVYSHPYRRDGSGLHWFKDPEDGETYLFSQFEAYDFNKVFPGFDQPDLKASYQLQVTAPAHWQVVSAVRESRVEKAGDQATWHFPETELFSTYVFSLHAGPYKVWEDASFRVPLRLLARQSYQEFVDVEEWFKVTRQGFDFFDNYFGTPYPFSKYDQLLVPDFVFGAMENVGAVTFTERLQPRRDKTRSDRRTMAVVVMHEMAHHWFGDLVTMKWWDDIWLNESFADLMGNFATAQATEYTEAMQSFSTSRKSWGYSEDQWITTHPIVQDIPDTGAVMSSIDGITYAKGAASLIQLKHLIGEDTFQRALASHFQRYAWKNATLTDFLATLGEAAGRDLSGWSGQWLEQSGVNALQASYRCEAGKIARFSVQQTPANVSGALREHQLDALLISGTGQQLAAIAVTGAETAQPALVGQTCPDFVLLNASDYTFARILFDPASVAYLRDHLADFQDPVQKGLIWRALWESVIEGKMTATGFLDLALRYLPAETNTALLGPVLGSANGAYSYLNLRPFVRTTQDNRAGAYRAKLEAMAWAGYQSQDPALKRLWFGQWLDYLHSPAQLKKATQLLASDSLSMDDRWALAGVLVRERQREAQTWLDRLSAKDSSASGKLNRLAAEAMAPDIAIKRHWIAESQKADSDYAYTDLRKILGNLFPLEQHGLNLQLKDELFGAFNAMTGVQTPVLQATFAASVLPRLCSPEGEQQYLTLADQPALAAPVVKTLKKGSQAESRCVTVQHNLD